MLYPNWGFRVWGCGCTNFANATELAAMCSAMPNGGIDCSACPASPSCRRP